jgi:hypothetical protein
MTPVSPARTLPPCADAHPIAILLRPTYAWDGGPAPLLELAASNGVPVLVFFPSAGTRGAAFYRVIFVMGHGKAKESRR